MATAPDPLIAWLLDELQPLAAQIGEICARRMFGGAGLYHDDIVFALVTRGTCYLRVDDVTRARLAAEGGTPFQYEREGRTITIAGYLSTPADALDGGQPLRDWVRLAIEAARRAANAKAAKPKRAPAKSATEPAGTKKKAPARKTTARAKR
ncbi:TfoX/Sxy family protein [Ralstonia pseudosolanacearum]